MGRGLPRETHSLREVLAVFMTDPSAEQWGYNILQLGEVKSGTLYPILARLEECGLAESRVEDPELIVDEDRPARRYYRLTPRGSQWADEVLTRRRGVRRAGRAQTDPALGVGQ